MGSFFYATGLIPSRTRRSAFVPGQWSPVWWPVRAIIKLSGSWADRRDRRTGFDARFCRMAQTAGLAGSGDRRMIMPRYGYGRLMKEYHWNVHDALRDGEYFIFVEGVTSVALEGLLRPDGELAFARDGARQTALALSLQRRSGPQVPASHGSVRAAGSRQCLR